MKKLLGLLTFPVCAIGAGWAIPEADNIHSFDTSSSHILQPAALSEARQALAEELGIFQQEPTLDGAFELLEDTLVLEAMNERRAIPLACFTGHNPSRATSDAATHYLMGDASFGTPVVPIARGQEPLYWEIDQLMEAATDPFFEFEDDGLFALIQERAEDAVHD